MKRIVLGRKGAERRWVYGDRPAIGLPIVLDKHIRADGGTLTGSKMGRGVVDEFLRVPCDNAVFWRQWCDYQSGDIVRLCRRRWFCRGSKMKVVKVTVWRCWRGRYWWHLHLIPA
jgi:hypothetical protein